MRTPRSWAQRRYCGLFVPKVPSAGLLYAEPGGLLDDCLRGFGMRHVIDDDIRAGLGQCQRDGLADAGIGAGNERLLAF